MNKLTNVIFTSAVILALSACSGNGHYSDDDKPNNNNPDPMTPGTPGTGGATISIIDSDPADNIVNESAAIGTATGLVALATGTQAGSTVSYSLPNSSGGLFAIDANTGVVTVAGALDFETAISHTVTVAATMANGASSQADFTIGVTDNQSPLVNIGFPGDNSLIIGDAITVTGGADDPEGDDIASVVIDINGDRIAAMVDANGVWRAPSVPLARGDNSLDVVVTDSDGEFTRTTLNINAQEVQLIAPGTTAVDSERNRAIVVDAGLGALVVIDLSNGELSRFPIDFIGSALPGSAAATDFFSLAAGAELDATGDRLFIVEDIGAGNNLLVVDLENDSISRLPVRVPLGAEQFVVDSANNRLLVLDVLARAITAVDLNTFAVSVISDAAVGSGPGFNMPLRLALDTGGNQLIVYDSGLRGFITVDLDNGNRALLATLPTAITDPRAVQSLEVDAAGNRLLASSSTSLLAINLANGNIGLFSGLDVITPSAMIVGAGPALSEAGAISFDSANNRILLADSSGRIVAIDPASGNRIQLAGNIDRLIASERYVKVVYDESNDRFVLFSAERGSDILLIKDMSSGTRSTVTIDQSSIAINVTEFAVDFLNNTAYFFTRSGDGIAALNLASGALTLVSDNTNIGNGIAFERPVALVLDPARNRLLYTDASYTSPGVRAIDLASGDRTVFFDEHMGSPSAIVIDAPNNRVLVVDKRIQALFNINLESGEGDCILVDTGNGSALAYASITVDSARDIAYIVSIKSEALISVNLRDSTTAVVAAVDDNGIYRAGGNLVGNGLGFIFPTSIAWDNANQRLLVTDPAVKALTAVEPISGDRIILFD